MASVSEPQSGPVQSGPVWSSSELLSAVFLGLVYGCTLARCLLACREGRGRDSWASPLLLPPFTPLASALLLPTVLSDDDNNNNSNNQKDEAWNQLETTSAQNGHRVEGEPVEQLKKKKKKDVCSFAC